MIEFRPALPQRPGAGAATAAGFRKRPAGASYRAIRRCNRGECFPSLPFRAPPPDRPESAASPLPEVICVAKVQSLNSPPFHPPSRVPPAMPIPVVYWMVAFSRCR